ncbi:hypothetical protein N7522_009998 [Penicillium canescens]|nr:hypothetical protein N7522_009998 [Penicillium canescens]
MADMTFRMRGPPADKAGDAADGADERAVEEGRYLSLRMEDIAVLLLKRKESIISPSSSLPSLGTSQSALTRDGPEK